MTFLSFLFVSCYGIVNESKFFTVKRHIGLFDYYKLVILFFISNLTNNQAYGYNVSVTLHIIFRSGSLIANLILGKLLLKKNYSFMKYISVIMITIGIIMFTLVSVKQDHNINSSCCDSRRPSSLDDNNSNFSRSVFGIALLSIALVTSALTGICQQYLTEKYGKFPNETLFYVHFLSIPGFLLWYNDIVNHLEIAANSDPFFIFKISVPVLYFYLFLNTIAIFFCIKSVYVLTAECSSLTVTLVITLRKFISLLISIMYFGNPFYKTHFIATILVFTGTLLFLEIFQTWYKTVSSIKLRSKLIWTNPESKLKVS